MRPMSEVRITAGGRELLMFIRASGMSIPVFCATHGLDRIQVQRVINGDRWQRISVDFAQGIERATGGAIPYTRFASTTAEPARCSFVEVSELRRKAG